MPHWRGKIPYKLDGWADPVAHLLLLKSSMNRVFLEHCSMLVKHSSYGLCVNTSNIIRFSSLEKCIFR